MKSLAIICNLTLVVGIFWLGMAPLPPGEVPMPSNDKVGHALAFFVVALAQYWLYLTLFPETRGIVRAARSRAGLATLGATSLGGALELAQLTVPARQAEFGDLVADFVGAVIGAALMLVVFR